MMPIFRTMYNDDEGGQSHLENDVVMEDHPDDGHNTDGPYYSLNGNSDEDVNGLQLDNDGTDGGIADEASESDNMPGRRKPPHRRLLSFFGPDDYHNLVTVAVPRLILPGLPRGKTTGFCAVATALKSLNIHPGSGECTTRCPARSNTRSASGPTRGNGTYPSIQT